MADKGPDFKAEQLKIMIQIETLKVGLIRAELEIVEAESRVKASKTNIESTHSAIAETQQKLKDAATVAHGLKQIPKASVTALMRLFIAQGMGILKQQWLEKVGYR